MPVAQVLTTTPSPIKLPAVESTTAAPAPEVTTSMRQSKFMNLVEETLNDTEVQEYVAKRKQEYKEEQARLEKEKKSTTSESQEKQFIVDNRLLKHSGPGMSYRLSKRLSDTKGKEDMATWGSIVTGVNEGDGWIRVGKDKYLPTMVRGIPVISQKVAGEFAEQVQFEQDDGTWAHGSIRSLGNWQQTFNIHIQDNAAGYDLDNVPERRLRHDLEASPQPTAGSGGSQLPLMHSEEAAASDEELPLTGDVDLAEDLPDGVFRPNVIAEVKINAGLQAGSWVRCRIVDRGESTDAYDLYVPSAPKGYQNMRNVPALAMRKLAAKSATLAPVEAAVATTPKIEEDSIDGEEGESVEVHVWKGPKAGQWLPGVIISTGTTPDSYNIRLPGVLKTHMDLRDVPGSKLRKANMKVEILEEEDYPTYLPGEAAMVVEPKEGGQEELHRCTIVDKGEFSNTYDMIDAQGITVVGVHAKFMRKISGGERTTTTTTAAPTPEPAVLNMRGVMQMITSLQDDLTQVFSLLSNSKKELRVWKKRSLDWEEGCSAQDRRGFVSHLMKMGEASSDFVFRNTPQECSMTSWKSKDSGVMWDELITCFAAAGNTSRECATCPSKFLLNVAEGCLAKCQPMLIPCIADEEGRLCAQKAAHCMDCIQEPTQKLLKCMNSPSQEVVGAALKTITKSGKAGLLDIEQGLRSKLSPRGFANANHAAFYGIRTLTYAWKAIMGRSKDDPSPPSESRL